jgi:hypothetical protein
MKPRNMNAREPSCSSRGDSQQGLRLDSLVMPRHYRCGILVCAERHAARRGMSIPAGLPMTRWGGYSGLRSVAVFYSAEMSPLRSVRRLVSPRRFTLITTAYDERHAIRRVISSPAVLVSVHATESNSRTLCPERR